MSGIIKYLPIFLLIMGTACSGLGVNNTTSDPIEQIKANVTPVPGNGAMVGQILNQVTGEPMTDTIVRLARVFWNEDQSGGAFVLEGATSPSAVTSLDGTFAFSNVPPADYVLVVGEVIGYNVIIQEEDGSARIYTINPDEILEIKPLSVNLTQ